MMGNAPSPKNKNNYSRHRCPHSKSFSPNTPPRPLLIHPLPIPSSPTDRPTIAAFTHAIFTRTILPVRHLEWNWTWTFVPFPICFVGRARAVKLSSALPAPRRVSSALESGLSAPVLLKSSVSALRCSSPTNLRNDFYFPACTSSFFFFFWYIYTAARCAYLHVSAHLAAHNVVLLPLSNAT
jgi:hypothetical protein